jgi:enterochelin esterase-like enzyme
MDLLLREHYVGPMIVVSPSVSTGYLNDDECLDAPGHFALEHYLAVDVVGAIDHTFRTYRDRAHRAIGGMSSGGYCALNIGLHHLHRFSVILASEPYGDPGLHPLHRLLHGDWPLWRANSPSFYLPLWHFYLPVASFLDSGGFDPHTTTNALRLARQLALRGQEATYRPAPHQHHNWREARAALPYALIFAWQHFGHMADGGSDAADLAQFIRVLDYAQTLPPPRDPKQRAQPTTTASATGTPTSATPAPSGSRTASPTPSQPTGSSTSGTPFVP